MRPFKFGSLFRYKFKFWVFFDNFAKLKGKATFFHTRMRKHLAFQNVTFCSRREGKLIEMCKVDFKVAPLSTDPPWLRPSPDGSRKMYELVRPSKFVLQNSNLLSFSTISRSCQIELGRSFVQNFMTGGVFAQFPEIVEKTPIL